MAVTTHPSIPGTKMYQKLAKYGLILALIASFGVNYVYADTRPAIVIHGGAGSMTKSSLSDEKEALIRAKLRESVQAGYRALLDGAPATEAVTTAVNILEDSPLFNAGKGAVFSAAGRNELDAAIMEGAELNAGAVAAITHIKNPINLALKVMTNSRHVMLIGEGAEAFASQQGFELVDPAYFYTEQRYQQLQKIKSREAAEQTSWLANEPDRWFSTVGAVALDKQGNLAAGTSTGGMTNKRWGRVGDVPIIGAGTYANNNSCAISATGHGEYFIRNVVAYNICNRVEHGTPLEEAADVVVNDVLVKAGGSGGVIALDPAGNIATPFNTQGMYRASIDREGQVTIAIYHGESP